MVYFPSAYLTVKVINTAHPFCANPIQFYLIYFNWGEFLIDLENEKHNSHVLCTDCKPIYSMCQ